MTRDQPCARSEMVGGIQSKNSLPDRGGGIGFGSAEKMRNFIKIQRNGSKTFISYDEYNFELTCTFNFRVIF